jgi:hypothetical protein
MAPTVVIVSGYRDSGFEKVTGTRFAAFAWTQSWVQRFADAGLHAVAYASEEPAESLPPFLQSLEGPAGLFACSGHGPVALSALLNGFPLPIACAVLEYAYTLDADAASQAFRFANPCAGRTIDDLRDDAPLLLVRAGRDEMPGLNTSLDAFTAGALRRNLPLSLINHAEAPHAFDAAEEVNERTRAVIAAIVRFFGEELCTA